MGNEASPARVAQGVGLLGPDWTLSVVFEEPGILHVRRHAGTGAPPQSALIRYGFFRDDWPDIPCRLDPDAPAPRASSELLTATLHRDGGGRLTIEDASGKVLLREHEPPAAGADPGFRVRFQLPEDMVFFGLGDQARDRIEHRGTKGDLWVRNVRSYIPIPLVLTNHGVGILINTTRRVRYDLGATSDEWFGFEADGATLDYYVLYGPTLKEIIGRYTALTGRPPLPPKWVLGLWFICRTQADAREFLDDCRAFRREGIPCDGISLEPGWMAKNYDFSVDKDWHPERFPVPSYARAGRHNFFPAAQRMGFKPALWLCCDYDLSYEEERRLRQAATSDQDEGASAEGHEQDEHLEGVRRLDTLTKPHEPWFDHLKQFVDQGCEGFKQDGANQVLAHPDRLYGNAMRDDEMHNLYPLLYSKQMHLGFSEHTGRRPFAFTVAGWAGLQRYTATWTGDTGGEEGPLGACLNLSLSGHGMTTCDMEATTRQGIHFGFLLPWAQLNSWNYWRHPWYLGHPLQDIFTDYARLRYRLLPYLYSCAWEAHTSGVPMLRAMPLEFPDDSETRCLVRQFMLGPALLVGAFTDRVYLPQGDWLDFWTEQRVSGPRWVAPEVPENRGGPLFVRAGSILPMGPQIDYVGQRPDDEVTVHVYAGAAGRFTLYEDDGTTFAHEEGQFRTTEITQQSAGGELRVDMAAARGAFTDAPTSRRLCFVCHGLPEPSRVALDGADAGPDQWIYQGETGVVTVAVGRREVNRRTGLGITL